MRNPLLINYFLRYPSFTRKQYSAIYYNFSDHHGELYLPLNKKQKAQRENNRWPKNTEKKLRKSLGRSATT